MVTYESDDLYWTIGIALALLVIAFFAGILNFQKPERGRLEKETPVIEKQTPKPESTSDIQIVQDDLSLDDISLGDSGDVNVEPVVEEEPEQVEEIVAEPEEEVIDIDDSTASGRLSALRREMASEPGSRDNSKEELSKRLDSFMKDR